MVMKAACRKGASAIEFALVLPILVVLAFGTIEFALLMYNQQVITNASREGARAGIVQTPRLQSSDIQTVVNNYCASRLVTFSTGVSPQTTSAGVPCSWGNNLTVTVSYDYYFLVISNFLPGLGPIKTLQAHTVMRCE